MSRLGDIDTPPMSKHTLWLASSYIF